MDQYYGKDISIFEESFLMSTLNRRSTSLGVAGASGYSDYLAVSRSEADELSCALTITYSRFFRDPLIYALLREKILPALFRQKTENGEIRIWSAGCSSGQEPYSIAMLLEDLAVAERKPVRYRIFATDISRAALDAASEGIYSRDAVREVKLRQLDDYFSVQGNDYAIARRLRDHISFSTYDLLDRTSVNPSESIYGDFDIVICSNLLFYYNHDAQDFIIEKLKKSLTPKGYLVTGETERAIVEKKESLKTLALQAAVFEKTMFK